MDEVVTMKFTVEFYEKENGEIPVINFIDSLEPKMGAKVLSLIEILEEKGNQLRLPYSECLEDGFLNYVVSLVQILHVLCISSMKVRILF